MNSSKVSLLPPGSATAPLLPSFGYSVFEPGDTSSRPAAPVRLVYDGSFAGLLSLFYQAWADLPAARIQVHKRQMDLFDALPGESSRYVPSSRKTAAKVWSFLERKYGPTLPRDFYSVFLAQDEDKDDVLARCLFLVLQHGSGVLQSAKPQACRYQALLRQVRSETHLWLGLLRFEEVQEGWLYAAFEPKHDVLSLVAPYFTRRFNAEHFLIHDRRRGRLACYGVPQHPGQAFPAVETASSRKLQYLQADELELRQSAAETVYAEAWKCFYRAVKISERENLKLMQSNMPKRYWKHLTERA